MSRINHEPGYVLHHYDWSETSLILEVFCRNHGRMALVAKGAKRPSSSFRPVLLPLQPLLLSWGGDAEIRTLKSAEWAGGKVMPTGERLLYGYYANELLMRLLAREDAHERLFDAYAALVHVLAGDGAGDALHAAALRSFELILLRESGHLPALDQQTLTLKALESPAAYTLDAQNGLRAATTITDKAAPAAPWLAGASWTALSRALASDMPFAAIFQACADLPGEQRTALRLLLRELLDHHCGTNMLRTRQLFQDLQAFQ
ncbi:MAG: DNA repair protein RecO [Burkholderiaceae bacterium]|jgi:DNA repair protein RecO (recombination protein O)|nr:DNA repair protein RecO [Burkholderiaceae bacterium]